MTSDTVVMLIRYVLLFVGGILSARGWVTNDQIELIMGAVSTVVPALWGLFVKWNTKAVPVNTAARKDVPTVSPVTGTVQK
jgi:hypothetical protein